MQSCFCGGCAVCQTCLGQSSFGRAHVPTEIPWAQVGDQSDFVNSFSKTLSELGPKIGAALNENHFRFFCDKLANSLAPRFFEAIFRCRKIGEAGSQQLLLDTQAIKGLLLEFPTAGKRPPIPLSHISVHLRVVHTGLGMCWHSRRPQGVDAPPRCCISSCMQHLLLCLVLVYAFSQNDRPQDLFVQGTLCDSA